MRIMAVANPTAQRQLNEQIRIQQLLHDTKEDEAFKFKVCQIREITKRSEDEIATALHDSNYNEDAALELLLESDKGEELGEWQQTNPGKKKKPGKILEEKPTEAVPQTQTRGRGGGRGGRGARGGRPSRGRGDRSESEGGDRQSRSNGGSRPPRRGRGGGGGRNSRGRSPHESRREEPRTVPDAGDPYDISEWPVDNKPSWDGDTRVFERREDIKPRLDWSDESEQKSLEKYNLEATQALRNLIVSPPEDVEDVVAGVEENTVRHRNNSSKIPSSAVVMPQRLKPERPLDLIFGFGAVESSQTQQSQQQSAAESAKLSDPFTPMFRQPVPENRNNSNNRLDSQLKSRESEFQGRRDPPVAQFRPHDPFASASRDSGLQETTQNFNPYSSSHSTRDPKPPSAAAGTQTNSPAKPLAPPTTVAYAHHSQPNDLTPGKSPAKASITSPGVLSFQNSLSQIQQDNNRNAAPPSTRSTHEASYQLPIQRHHAQPAAPPQQHHVQHQSQAPPISASQYSSYSQQQPKLPPQQHQQQQQQQQATSNFFGTPLNHLFNQQPMLPSYSHEDSQMQVTPSQQMQMMSMIHSKPQDQQQLQDMKVLQPSAAPPSFIQYAYVQQPHQQLPPTSGTSILSQLGAGSAHLGGGRQMERDDRDTQKMAAVAQQQYYQLQHQHQGYNQQPQFGRYVSGQDGVGQIGQKLGAGTPQNQMNKGGFPQWSHH